MQTALPLLAIAPWISICDLRSHRIPNLSLLVLLLFIEANSLISHQTLSISRYLFATTLFIVSWVGSACLRRARVGTAIGMGDLKLFAICSFLLGNLRSSLNALLIACCLALLAAFLARKKVIPFAPALLLGTFIVLTA